MERKYNKDECWALLRNSADARYYRASMVIGAGLFGVGLLIGIMFLLIGVSLRENADLWSCSLLLLAMGAIAVLYDGWRLRQLYHRWDQYIYARATVGKEEATLDWRYPATALWVMSRGGAELGCSMKTRNMFHQKYAFGVLDWPLVSEYANCQVIAAFDQKKDRAIILQRDYRTRT